MQSGAKRLMDVEDAIRWAFSRRLCAIAGRPTRNPTDAKDA
jgi:hypothetical protein